jgi:hypothetical protein
MTDQPQPPNGNGLSGADMLALIAHMTDLLSKMENRIMERLDDNSRGASERWAKHDRELEANTKRVIARFEIVEADLLTVSKALGGHLDREHDEELATQARVKPIRTVGLIVVQNWKSIALALFALLGILGWAGLETHIAGQ